MLRALIVEDDFTSRKILQAMLMPFGECDVAVDGDEALEAFSSALGQGAAYNLVCLDINMPGMNGHEVLSEIRNDEDASGISGLDRAKIVMTTASSDRNDVRTAFHAQCDAYLVKPIAQDKLLDVLTSLGLI
jgi:two-component system chemotaxis response regulator CheY